jgi:hypothetical protein
VKVLAVTELAVIALTTMAMTASRMRVLCTNNLSVTAGRAAVPTRADALQK